jgi:UPF0271 protein
MSVRPLDLNCDVGEAETAENRSQERDILAFVTSINVACGGHAGSPAEIRRVLEAAVPLGIAIGAHPGFPDRASHGRREQTWTASSIRELIFSQLELLRSIGRDVGAVLSHVKPHGALYNMAARDGFLAAAIAAAVHDVDPLLILVGLAGSELIQAGAAHGLRVASEGFVDRAYRSDGTLVPRNQAGAVLTDERAIVQQATALALDGVITTAGGTICPLRIDTLCLHGDTPGSRNLARVVHSALTAVGITLRRIDHVV